ncbi:DUF4253 domain-containing protein [Streptomyces sp. HPF1205]|uniref:DUF4253 domain-containing protein n=1 Tax=Streptomyces sp. HPF1205 TaxID=2873262 RepID=UPI001CEDAEC6|nr:DUF4253 domain-containing protein [Streptomyces sp. HPF1205]
MTFTLPDGLPPGRSELPGSAGIWISDDLPEDIEGLWSLLLDQQEVTGLFPLLCWPGTPARSYLAEADAIRLEPVLAAAFAEYRRRRLPLWSGAVPAAEDVPEGVEAWPRDPGPPFEDWPGLAPPVAVAADSLTPAQAAGRTVGRLVATGWHEFKDCRLALVPARRSADLPALLEWSSQAPVPLVCALLRSWEERFGAQVVSACGNSLHVSVARPPQSLQDAELLACEHVLSTAHSIVDDPPTTFPDYATGLVGRSDWWFWWD